MEAELRVAPEARGMSPKEKVENVESSLPESDMVVVAPEARGGSPKEKVENAESSLLKSDIVVAVFW